MLVYRGLKCRLSTRNQSPPLGRWLCFRTHRLPQWLRTFIVSLASGIVCVKGSMRKPWLSVTWWSYGPKAPHCYVSVVLQPGAAEYREGEGNGTAAANPLGLFLLLRKEFTIEAVPVSQYKGVKHSGFLSASFIGPSPNDFYTIAMRNLCLLQLLKWQLKYLKKLRWNCRELTLIRVFISRAVQRGFLSKVICIQ